MLSNLIKISMIFFFSLNWYTNWYSVSSINYLSINILLYPQGLTLTFHRVKLFEPDIMLFISINESTVNYMLLESVKLFLMYTSASFNLSELISLNSFSETKIFFKNFFVTCYVLPCLRKKQCFFKE